MTFRGRLRVFFAMIVVVPMVAIGIALLSLTASSETGKSDAGLANALTVAFASYEEGRATARDDLRAVAADNRLTEALARGDRAEAERRLRIHVRSRPGLVEASVTGRGAVIRAGSARAIAPASASLTGTGGDYLGTLSVSVTDARAFAKLVERRTRDELMVLRDGRVVASTVSSVTGVPKGSGDFEANGKRYRGRRARVLDRPGRTEELAVFADASGVGDEINRSRLLVGVLLLTFLALALAASAFVSRALQSQIGTFLEGARRLASGRFGEPVPVEGNDEFAQLGREFNSMSAQLEAQIEEVQRKRRELETAIRRVGEALASGLDRQGIFDLLVENAVQACEASAGRGEPIAVDLLKRTMTGDPERFAGLMARAERAAATSRDQRPFTEFDGDLHVASVALAVRLGTEPSARPVACVSIARTGEPFSADQCDLLDYLARQAVVSIENASLHETVRRQAVTDELTGLSNVRQMHGALDREFERGRRFNTSVGFVLLDLDDFKLVNDTYGHQQGDEVLTEVADVLRELSRDIDEPARYGGEEMAVVLPQTEIEGAAQLAERMREAIEGLRIPRLDGQGDLRVTASFGVAAVPSSASDKTSLIAAADDALYRAKRAGKNRVERAEAVTA